MCIEIQASYRVLHPRSAVARFSIRYVKPPTVNDRCNLCAICYVSDVWSYLEFTCRNSSFWPVKFSSVRPGPSNCYNNSDMGLEDETKQIPSPCHPPFRVGSFANYAMYSTGQNIADYILSLISCR